MADPRFVAVLDVGKTNVKTVLFDGLTGEDLATRTMPNTVLADGPYPHFDVPRIQAFLLDSLADLVRGPAPVDAVSITTHGAGGALIGPAGLVLPVLDYEFEGPDRLAAPYDAIRPPFAETFSPRLPGGLNLGAQLFWQAKTWPEAFAGATFVTYPQYWAWWLTGVPACERTSLGAHSDLWAPREGAFSSLVEKAGWTARMAPLRSAFDRLGPVRPDLAARIGLSHALPVACGIHDSNASLLPYIQGASAPLAVVSTGTWVICLAVGGALDGLDAARDTLANVDAYGRPVPSARFMGGREFDILVGQVPVTPAPGDVAKVLGLGVMALPTFAPGNGPYPRGRGRWSHDPATLSPAERTAAASLYAALMTATCLDSIAAAGPTVVEGPFARNTLFCGALGVLTGRPVSASSGTGTSAGAARLALGGGGQASRGAAPAPFGLEEAALQTYARAWRRETAAP